MRLRRATFRALPFLVVLFALAGCSDRDLSELELAEANDDPVVFDDTFGAGVDFQAFMGSAVDAVAIDTQVGHNSAASLRITVPGPGSQNGTFAGGAFTSGDHRDLSSYDALVFYARASVASTLNTAGLGNDNTGTSLYEAQRSAIPVGTDWTQVIIPIPDPSRLTLERGLFWFAEGFEGDQGYTLWFDEIRFARIGTITSPRPAMASRSVDSLPGAAIAPQETRVTFGVNGLDITVEHSPRYFDFFSSDEAVATVADGAITAAAGGTATITAKLDTIDVAGAITINVLAPPADPAPAPTYPAADVIALFSGPYTGVPVDTWRTDWSVCGPLTAMSIGDDAVKVYSELTYAGIEFANPTLDITDMTHVRVDVWAPSGSIFRLKLVDFGADGAYHGEPDSEWELTFNQQTEPPFVAGQWVVLDIPLTRFRLTSRAHLAQMVISSPNARTVFVDNVLFHR